jgi:hypothetical protein
LDDELKNKAELIAELVAIRERVAELENGSLNEMIPLTIVKSLLDYVPVPIAILDKEGYWNQIEAYIREHSDVEFSHSVCPECAKKLYPELDVL